MKPFSVEQQLIRSNFPIHSRDKYLWKIGKSNLNTRKEIFRNFFTVLISAFLPFIVLYAISLISPLIACLLAGIFVAIAVYIKVSEFTTKKNVVYYENEEIEDRESLIVKDAVSGEFKKMFSAIFFLFLASCIIYLASSPYLNLRNSFVGEINSIYQWLLFYVDNILKVLLLDTSEIMGLQFSQIKADSQGSKLINLLLNLSITAGLLEVILSIYKSEAKEIEFVGTMAEAYGIMVMNTGSKSVDVYQISGEKNKVQYTTSDFSGAYRI